MSKKNWSTLWRLEKLLKNSICGAISIFFIFSFEGCSYQSSLENPPPSYTIKENVHLSRLSIPVFVNRTFEPLLENILTRRFRQQALMAGHLKLESDRQKSDMILEGQIVSFAQAPLSFDANNSALEYRISLVLQMALKDAQSGKVLWGKSGLTGTADYYVNVDASLNRAALDRAIDEASKVLAENVISEILDLYR